MPAAPAKQRPRSTRRGSRSKQGSTTRYGGISDAAVERATGHGWAHWLKVLDRFDVKKRGHKAAAEHLHAAHGCSAWWSQMVTVGYEQARGLRAVHQKADGYSASASRTIAAPVKVVYAAWAENARAAWLGDANVVVRRATANKSMRMAWTDAKSTVEVNFYDKTGKSGSAKCQVAVQHDKLKNAAQVKKMKAYWGAALEGLREGLEAGKKI